MEFSETFKYAHRKEFRTLDAYGEWSAPNYVHQYVTYNENIARATHENCKDTVRMHEKPDSYGDYGYSYTNCKLVKITTLIITEEEFI
jgi:hypothetical protein